MKNDDKNGKMVPSGNEYVNLKTIQEAEDYAKNTLGITAFYDGLDINIINETNKSLTDAIQYSDKMVNYIHAVGCAQLREGKLREELRIELEIRAVNKGWDLKSPKVQKVIEDFIKKQVQNISPNVYAYNAPISKIPDVGIKNIKDKYAGIFINKKYGQDITIFNEHLKDDVRTKFHPIGCDKYKATIDHEIGHVLDIVFDLSNDLEVIKEWNDFNKLSINDRNDVLSEYAYNNNNKIPIKEFIAEAYAEYKNNTNPRQIAKTIGEIIERKAQNAKNIK